MEDHTYQRHLAVSNSSSTLKWMEAKGENLDLHENLSSKGSASTFLSASVV